MSQEASGLEELWARVYNLAWNFLHNQAQAEDATQDILAKALEALGTFRGESSLATWVYRIAWNHLIDLGRQNARQQLTFRVFARDLAEQGPRDGGLGLTETEIRLYAGEVKAGCTRAMLLCLKPEERLVFILGRLLGLPGQAAAAISSLSHDNYRQTLSRASTKLRNFMNHYCSAVNPEAACACERRIGIAAKAGRISLGQPGRSLGQPGRSLEPETVREHIGRMEQLDKLAGNFRDRPWQAAGPVLRPGILAFVRAAAGLD